MSLILIADTLEGAVTLQRILDGHELVVVHTLEEAKTKLEELTFDLIVAALHFDESHMFELFREVSKHPNNASKPIISFCSRDTEMTRVMHESLSCSTTVLGAWMYLNEHAYNVYKDPDAELRRVMERCLTEEARKELHQQRLDIQKQRIQIQQLRVMLQAQEWSPQMNEYLVGLRHELELLLLQVTTLQSSAANQRASVISSRDQKDRVSENVTIKENDMSLLEEIQSQEEARQSVAENKLVQTEEKKRATKSPGR